MILVEDGRVPMASRLVPQVLAGILSQRFLPPAKCAGEGKRLLSQDSLTLLHLLVVRGRQGPSAVGRGLALLAGMRKSAGAMWAGRVTAAATSTKLCHLELGRRRQAVSPKPDAAHLVIEQ